MKASILRLAGVMILLTCQQSFAQWTDSCRATCLAETSHRHSHALREYSNLVNAIRKFHSKHRISGTVILYDNTVYSHEHQSSSSSSSSSYSSEVQMESEMLMAEKLERFQKLLALLILAAYPTGINELNPAYWVQFDDDNAWSCQSWRCSGGCTAMLSILQDINPFTISKRHGRLDEACYISEIAQHDHSAFCGNDSENRLVIGIFNSPLGIQHKDKDSSSDEDHEEVSCCMHNYPHRFGIGHFRASKKDLESWSTHSDGFYVHSHNLDALESLVSCMTSCACGFVPDDYLPSRTGNATYRRATHRQSGGEECQITQPRFSYQIYTKSKA